MKPLNLPRPLMILVVGLPGAGKSFFANKFSETFGICTISMDRIRFELFENPKYSADETAVAVRIVDYMAEECLKTKRSFMIDGACNSSAERQKFRALAKEKGYGTLIVWLQTDIATAMQRATRRNQKRTGDAYNTSLSKEQFDSLARRLTSPQREEYVVISGKHAYSTQARMVLRKLATPHVEAAEQAHQQERRTASRPTPPGPSPRRNVIIR